MEVYVRDNDYGDLRDVKKEQNGCVYRGFQATQAIVWWFSAYGTSTDTDICF